MPEYRITWEIDLWADSPREAAEQALTIHRNPESIATVFDVTDETGHTERIDLDEADDEEACAACGRSLEVEENAIHFPHRRNRRREKLARSRPGAQSLPG